MKSLYKLYWVGNQRNARLCACKVWTSRPIAQERAILQNKGIATAMVRTTR